MIFNMVGAAGKKPFIPQFTGKAKLVLLDGGKAGYMEFYTSGTLTWLDDKVPDSVDLFCVGGGGGGCGRAPYADYIRYGAGGGGGYTTTVLAAQLPPSVEVTIGAGGFGAGYVTYGTTTGSTGGATSIGSLCIALGGEGGRNVSNVGSYGGKGGSGGGAGGNDTSSSGGVGGSNGSNGGNGHGTGGQGQGTPTTDLLGRRHAGGGGGGHSKYPGTSTPGGASDFTDGRGHNGSRLTGYESTLTNANHGLGGGGFGGGGGGGGSLSSTNEVGGTGGQGFAMIAWGNYQAYIGGG